MELAIGIVLMGVALLNLMVIIHGIVSFIRGKPCPFSPVFKSFSPPLPPSDMFKSKESK